MISIPTKPTGCAKRYLLFVVLTILLPAVQAGGDLYVADLQAQAQNQQIWQKTEWINLLHYNGNGDQPDAYVSDVNDERFSLPLKAKQIPRTSYSQQLPRSSEQTSRAMNTRNADS